MIYRFLDDAPECDPDSWVAPGARIMGKVTLKRDASVWYNAVLRGDNERLTIGEGSNVQDNAVLHSDPGFPCTVGRGVTIGHGAIVHGCTVGDNCLIGMGATVMNGAVIGANSIVGANALVTEGRSFPPGSLIMGAPAKAVKELGAEAQAAIAKSAERYVWNYKRHRDGLEERD